MQFHQQQPFQQQPFQQQPFQQQPFQQQPFQQQPFQQQPSYNNIPHEGYNVSGVPLPHPYNHGQNFQCVRTQPTHDYENSEPVVLPNGEWTGKVKGIPQEVIDESLRTAEHEESHRQAMLKILEQSKNIQACSSTTTSKDSGLDELDFGDEKKEEPRIPDRHVLRSEMEKAIEELKKETFQHFEALKEYVDKCATSLQESQPDGGASDDKDAEIAALKKQLEETQLKNWGLEQRYKEVRKYLRGRDTAIQEKDNHIQELSESTARQFEENKSLKEEIESLWMEKESLRCENSELSHELEKVKGRE